MAEDTPFSLGNNIYHNQFDILPVKWLKRAHGRTSIKMTDGQHTPFLKQLHFVAANNMNK